MSDPEASTSYAPDTTMVDAPTSTSATIKRKSPSEPTPNEPPTSPSSSALVPTVGGTPGTVATGSDKENKPAKKRVKLESAKGKEKEAGTGNGAGAGNGLVELTKGGKWSVKQKVLELGEVSMAVKKRVLELSDHLSTLEKPLTQFSDDQLTVIAQLAHGSDKTLPDLARHIRNKLLPMSAFEDEEAHGSEASFDRLPIEVMKCAIDRVAKRVNSGISDDELSWLPNPVPAALKIHRWEANDFTVIPPDLREKMAKRDTERGLIKQQTLSILENLNEKEREELVAKVSGKRVRGKEKEKDKVVVLDEVEEEDEGGKEEKKGGGLKTKAKVKETDVEKEAKQMEREAKKAEKEAKAAEAARKKAERDEKKRVKEAAEAAAKSRVEEQRNLMTGFFKSGTTKRSISPDSTRKPLPSLVVPATPSSALSSATKKGVVSCDSSPAYSRGGGVGGSAIKRGLTDFDRTFKPYAPKTTVEVAPVNRFCKPGLGNGGFEEKEVTKEEALQDFISSVPAYRRPVGVRRPVPEITAKEVVNGIAENELAGNVDATRRWRALLGDRQKLVVKRLRFTEDVRPGYVGTWTKTSRAIRPRNPFGRDSCLINYDYDSEAEWDENDNDGEDLNAGEVASDDDDDGGGGSSDSDNEDGWLVGDDEVEMVDGASELGEPMDDIVFMGSTAEGLVEARRKKDSERKNRASKESAKKRKLIGPLVPIVKGTIWEDELGKVEAEAFAPYRIEFLNDAGVGIDPFTFVPTPVDQLVASVAVSSELEVPKAGNTNASSVIRPAGAALIPSANPAAPNATTVHPKDNTKIRQTIGFPTTLMPQLIAIVDGAKRTKSLMIEDLKVAFEGQRITKVAIERALIDSAVKKGGVWVVLEEVRKAHGVPVAV